MRLFFQKMANSLFRLSYILHVKMKHHWNIIEVLQEDSLRNNIRSTKHTSARHTLVKC